MKDSFADMAPVPVPRASAPARPARRESLADLAACGHQRLEEGLRRVLPEGAAQRVTVSAFNSFI